MARCCQFTGVFPLTRLLASSPVQFHFLSFFFFDMFLRHTWLCSGLIPDCAQGSHLRGGGLNGGQLCAGRAPYPCTISRAPELILPELSMPRPSTAERKHSGCGTSDVQTLPTHSRPDPSSPPPKYIFNVRGRACCFITC